MKEYYKNKGNRDKPRYLSKKDRFAYVLIYIAIFLFDMFLLLIYLSVKNVIAFDDINIIASADQVGVWWILPLGLFVLAHIPYIDISCRWNDVPIFKRKNADENIKSPTSQKEHVYKRDRLNKIQKSIIWLIVLAVCILFSLLGLFSRACVDTEGNLHRYNFLNKEIAVLSIDEVESLTIKASPEHRRSSAEFWLTLHYSGGYQYEFYNTSFDTVTDDMNTDAINGMLQLKALIPEEKITIIGKENLDDVIEMFSLDGKQAKLLYKLFEVK